MLTGRIYHPEDKHPPEWEKDLNPNASGGLNYGVAGPHPERTPGHTAYDVKDAHQLLQDFNDDELKQMPVLPDGSPLEQGAVYVDLRDEARQEFQARGGDTAQPGQLIIPKAETGYQLWNRLCRKSHPGAPAK